MQQGNGQFVLPYTAQQVAAASGDMHIQEAGELPATFQHCVLRLKRQMSNFIASVCVSRAQMHQIGRQPVLYLASIVTSNTAACSMTEQCCRSWVCRRRL